MDLTEKEAADLNAQIQPILRYLHVLTNRMEKRGWPEDDRLRLAAEKAMHGLRQAYDGIHTLSVLSHYASLPQGQVPRG